MREHGLRVVLLSAIAAACSACASGGLKERLAALEQRQAALDQRANATEQKLAQLQKIDADVEAVKAYFKQVEDKVRTMRSDIIRLLDEQRLRMEEGREEYVRVLRSQEQLLRTLLPQLGDAITKLQQKLPESGKRVTEEPTPPTLPPSPSPGTR